MGQCTSFPESARQQRGRIRKCIYDMNMDKPVDVILFSETDYSSISSPGTISFDDNDSKLDASTASLSDSDSSVLYRRDPLTRRRGHVIQRVNKDETGVELVLRVIPAFT